MTNDVSTSINERLQAVVFDDDAPAEEPETIAPSPATVTVAAEYMGGTSKLICMCERLSNTAPAIIPGTERPYAIGVLAMRLCATDRSACRFIRDYFGGWSNFYHKYLVSWIHLKAIADAREARELAWYQAAVARMEAAWVAQGRMLAEGRSDPVSVICVAR
jgi:hypothetical protein